MRFFMELYFIIIIIIVVVVVADDCGIMHQFEQYADYLDGYVKHYFIIYFLPFLTTIVINSLSSFVIRDF
jgi:glutathione peroxidase-family protein